MALVLLQPGGNPLGQFDGYDTATFKGGEVATLVGYSLSGTDKAAKDVFDGYADSALAPFQRPIVTTTLSSTSRPLYLVDEGNSPNYGTLFGQLVGSMAGQTVTGGTVLGPQTNLGSGKVTLWDKPGLFGVTTDAVDTTAGGLVITNGALSVGMLVYFTSAGLLTTSANKVSSGPAVGSFLEFSTGDGLVNTPTSLTRIGVAGGALTMKYVVIQWNPPGS